MATRMPPGGYLAIGFAMNLLLGTAYSWSVFRDVLVRDFGKYGADPFTALLPFAAAMAMFSIGMVLAGPRVDWHGPRKVAVMGTLLFSVGYLASSIFDQSPWPMLTLTLLYGGVVGLGTGFAYNPAIATAVRWFPVRKGLASGIVVMGVGLSPVITAPLASFLIGQCGLPTAFLVLGVIFSVALIPMSSVLRFPPDGRQPAPQRVARARRSWTPLGEVETREMLRSSSFWTAWTLYVLGTTEGFMIIGNAHSIAQEVGFSTDAVATAAVMVLAVFNSGGRPLFGRAADMFTPRRALLVMYVVLLGAMALLSVSTGWISVFAGIALTGLVFGGFLAVMPALSTLFFGTKHSGANYGALFTAFGVGNVVALFAGGWIRGASGTFIPAFYVGMVLSAVGLILSLEMKPPRPAAIPTP